MKSRSGETIKLTSIDELLGVVNEESAMEIEINRIHAFKNHPFKVLDDEKMADLIESVKSNGVLTPVLLRGLIILPERTSEGCFDLQMQAQL